MKTFPMFLKMEGRHAVVCGGGDEALRKVRLIAKTEARIVVAAETLVPELADMARGGRITHAPHACPALFAGAALVFIATGEEAEDLRLAALARKGGAVVNVVDRPEHCDALTPSIVDRDPVVVAIGTEGTAPVLGRRIKTAVEGMLPPGLGRLAAFAGRLRPAVEAHVPHARRRAFWEWAFEGTPAARHAQGDEAGAEALLTEAAHRGGAGETSGHIALVGAGPGARDLLTLRAVKRLQEADVIFYDRLVDPGVLELARRDADRVYVGKAVGACAWPQPEIDRLIVTEARKGRRVVRLKSGDPSVFGRAAEEIAAARAANVDVEIVPGITAASAAGAAVQVPLTERGETDSLILTTGTSRPGDPDPDRAHLARPGTAVCFYMAVERAERLRADLLVSGVPGGCPVEVISNVSLPSERRTSTTLAALTETLRAEAIPSPAILFLRYPKSMAAEAVLAAE